MKGPKRNTKSSMSRKTLGQDESPDELPQLTDQLETGKVLRFTVLGTGGSTSASVTFANLLDAWLVAGTATNAYQLFDFVRVKKVVVRAVAGANTGGNTVTVGVEYPGLVTGSAAGGKQASNSQMGISKIAMVSLKPDKMSACALWQASSNNVAFVVRSTDVNSTCCIGTIIDVHLAYKNSADVNPAAITSAAAGMTPGELYYGGIDGGRLAATWARSVFVRRI